MKKGAIILILLLINFSCFGQFGTHEMKKIFSAKEISDLKIINDYFLKSTCANDVKIDFKKCFEKKIPNIILYGYDSLSIKIDFEEQKEMYKKISETTFNEIWGYAKRWKKNDTLAYRYLGVNNIGKYRDYLIEIGKNNDFIDSYQESLYATGGLPWISFFLLKVYKNPVELNLDDQNLQLIIAIHILTDIDYGKREELWETE